jgi:hypothetical protein
MSWQFAMLAGRNNSYNSGGAAQWWTVKRSLDIFKIFDEVFGDSARERVVRVLPTQSGNGEVTDGLEQVRELSVVLPPLALTMLFHPSLLASLLAFPRRFLAEFVAHLVTRAQTLVQNLHQVRAVSCSPPALFLSFASPVHSLACLRSFLASVGTDSAHFAHYVTPHRTGAE